MRGCQTKKFQTIAERAIEYQSSVIGFPNSQDEIEIAVKDYITHVFEGLHSMFDSRSILSKAILNEFEVAFAIRYLNTEMGYESSEVFNQRLYLEITKYADFLFNMSDEYKDMFEAAVQIYNKTTRNKVYEESGKNDRENTNIINNTSGSVGSDTNKTDVSVNNTSDTNNTDTRTTTGTVKDEGNSSLDETSRVINTDYPQSTVNLNMNSPLDGNFDYASTGSDNRHNQSGSSSNTRTYNVSDDSHLVGKVVNSGTSSSSDTRTLTNNITSKSDESGTNNESYNRAGEEGEEVTNELDTISPLERTRLLMELVEKYRYSPIYKVLEYVEKLFMSTFVDDDRYHYLSTSFISNWWKGV